MPYIDPQRVLPRNPALRGYHLPSLAYWRMRRDFTQARLAQRSGLSLATIATLERFPASKIARYVTIYKLAGALGIAPQALTLPEPRPVTPTPPGELPYGYQMAIARRDGLPLPAPPSLARDLAPAPTGGKIISYADARAKRAYRLAHSQPYKQPW